jgi:hypothetical protein
VDMVARFSSLEATSLRLCYKTQARTFDENTGPTRFHQSTHSLLFVDSAYWLQNSR